MRRGPSIATLSLALRLTFGCAYKTVINNAPFASPKCRRGRCTYCLARARVFRRAFRGLF